MRLGEECCSRIGGSCLRSIETLGGMGGMAAGGIEVDGIGVGGIEVDGIGVGGIGVGGMVAGGMGAGGMGVRGMVAGGMGVGGMEVGSKFRLFSFLLCASIHKLK